LSDEQFEARLAWARLGHQGPAGRRAMVDQQLDAAFYPNRHERAGTPVEEAVLAAPVPESARLRDPQSEALDAEVATVLERGAAPETEDV
jgi:hypothetical protein